MSCCTALAVSQQRRLAWRSRRALQPTRLHPGRQHFRAPVPSIYAAGDVIGFPRLASTAMEQARVAVCHAFELRYKQQVSPVLPYGVWTIPEVAMVGETEDALMTRGISYEVGRSTYRTNARGQILGDTDGFVKLLFSPGDQKVLGVSMWAKALWLIHSRSDSLRHAELFHQCVFNVRHSRQYKYAAYDGCGTPASRKVRAWLHPVCGALSRVDHRASVRIFSSSARGVPGGLLFSKW